MDPALLLTSEFFFHLYYILTPSHLPSRRVFLKILTEIIHKLIHHRLISCLLKHRDHQVTPAVRVTDRDQDNTMPRLSTPGFFRPEADSKPCRDQVAHRLRTVALKHRLRRIPALRQKSSQIPRSCPAVSETDEFSSFTSRRSTVLCFANFESGGYCQKNLLPQIFPSYHAIWKFLRMRRRHRYSDP